MWMINDLKSKRNPIQRRRLKQVIIAFTSALSLGLLFGFFVLQMVREDIKEETAPPQTSAATIDTRVEMKKLPGIDLQVVQAGVFETEDNVRNWEQKFKNLNIPAITWQRAEQYYLFVGLGLSEAFAEEQVARIKELGLDAFVKVWHVEGKEISISDADYEWLTSFITLWENTLAGLEAGEAIDYDAWMELVVKADVLSDSVQALSAEIERLLIKDAVHDQVLNQEILFNLVYRYEGIFLEK